MLIGGTNNAPYIVMGNAMDMVKGHPEYRRKFSKVRGAFQHALKEWKKYENRLKYAREFRFFHVADMPADVKKKYGDITDEEYYDFWCGLGGVAWELSKNELNSLRYKYKKSLDQHGVEYSDIIAEVFLAQACLCTAVTFYEEQVKYVAEKSGLLVAAVKYVMGAFSLKPVADAWAKATLLLNSAAFEYELEEMEEKNIDLGLNQLAEKWSSMDFAFNSLSGATEDYQEVFRTKGEWKKSLREIMETRARFEEELGR